MKLSATCVSIVALALASACGASEDGTYIDDIHGDDTAAPDGAAEAAEGNLETLHRFEVQGATYTYLGDGEAVLLHVERPRTAPVARIVTETGEQPTLLETFSALQPGVVAHPELVAAHRESTLLLGREDDTVLPAHVVNAADVIEKTAADLADCRGYFLPVWGGGFMGGTPVVTAQEGTAAGTTVQASTASVSNKFMAAGACNFAAFQARTVAFDKRTGAGAWIQQISSSITVDNVNYIVHDPSGSAVNLRSRMVDAANQGMQLVAARRQ
jgi:hypothetical protein